MSQAPVVNLVRNAIGGWEPVDADVPRPVPCLRCPYADLDYPWEQRAPFSGQVVGTRKPFRGEVTTIWCRALMIGHGVSLKAAQAFGSRWGRSVREKIYSCAIGTQLPKPKPLTPHQGVDHEHQDSR